MLQKRLVVWPVLAVLLLFAFALRLHLLDAQSLSADEIMTVYAITTPIPEMFSNEALVDHPPIYFLLMRAWKEVMGTSESGVRSLSVIFGLLTIPLIYKIAHKLGGVAVGILAGGLASLSPFYIFYSQEARAYSLALLLSVLSFYFFLRCFETDKKIFWFAWALTGAAATLTEYVAVMVLISQEVFFVISQIISRELRWHRWMTSQTTIVILLLPWVYWSNTVSNVLIFAAGETKNIDFIGQAITAFGLGPFFRETSALFMTIPTYILVAFGLARGVASLRWRLYLAGSILLSLVIVYVASMNGLGLAQRHLLLATPSFLLLLAIGIKRLGSYSNFLLLASGLAFVIPNGLSLFNYYYNPVYSREDFRSAAKYLDDHFREGDVVVFNASWGDKYFPFYLREKVARLSMPRELPLNTAEVSKDLERLRAQYRRIWLVRWQDWFTDPGGFVERSLDGDFFPIGKVGFPYITIGGYLTESPIVDQVSDIQYPVSANFGGKVRLLGYDLDAEQVSTKGKLYLTLYWQSLEQIEESYRVFVQLRDLGNDAYGAKDLRPIYDRFPTYRWPYGKVIRDEYMLDVLAGTLPGDYYLAVGLYEPQTGQRLVVQGNDSGHMLLGPVQIRKPVTLRRPNQLDLPGGRNIVFGPLALKGYVVRALGYEGSKQLSANPGDVLRVLLLWRAESKPGKDYELIFSLGDEHGKLHSTRSSLLAKGRYPTSQWDTDEFVREFQEFRLPLGLSAGTYRLTMAVRGEKEVSLGTLQVGNRPASNQVPNIHYPTNARLGDAVSLIGYNLGMTSTKESLSSQRGMATTPVDARAGDVIKLTLFWRAENEIDRSYKVFTHVVDEQDRIWAQHDSFPQNGSNPTVGWFAGEVVTDEHGLQISSDTPRGRYRIEVGMYDELTGRRLTTGLPGAQIYLTEVKVE